MPAAACRTLMTHGWRGRELIAANVYDRDVSVIQTRAICVVIWITSTPHILLPVKIRCSHSDTERDSARACSRSLQLATWVDQRVWITLAFMLKHVS